MIDHERREAIRATVHERKQLAETLGASLTSSAYLKRAVKVTADQIGDVETLFLNDTRERSAQQEENWLNHADLFLAAATDQLSHWQGLISAFGADAITTAD